MTGSVLARQPTATTSRTDGWSGIAYVVLSVVSSAAVSLPLSSDPPARISALYEQHRTAYVLAQVLGLIGVAVFLRWVLALRRYDRRPPSIMGAGGLVALAAVGTNVAVLLLCLDTGLSTAGVHAAARATDITDDVLFACYVLLGLALAVSGLPRWLRYAAMLAAVVCALRAVRPWWAVPGLEAVAPLTILAVMVCIAAWILRGGPTGRPAAGRDDRTPAP